MSKGLGQKIVIKFTKDLVGDVTGLIPAPVAHGDYFRPLGTATASSQYSSYAPSRAFDGSTSSYWYTRTTGDQWVQIELTEPTWVYGFRWYIGSRYRPNGFDFQGSNDGENWEGILTGNSPNETGWHEFPADSPKQYKYYRWTITSRYASYLYVYEIELLGVAGNERAFTITGKEYQYVNGPLVDKEYQVEKVERYPTQRLWEIDKSIALEGEGWEEPFNDMNSWDIQYGGNKWNIVDFEGENVLRHYSTAQTRDVLIATNLGVLMDADIYCDVYITGTGTSGKRPSIATRIGGTVGSETLYTFQARARDNKIQIGKYVSGTFTELAYSSFNYKANTWYTIRALTEGNNLKFKIWERGQVEPSSWNLETTDNSIPSGYVGLFDFDGNGNSYFDNFELKGEYITPKIYTTEAIELSGEIRIRWGEDKPAITSILVEYTTGETQGQWQTVSNSEVINVDTNLWIKITLSTEDETVTPTIEDLWIEEPDAPYDQIRLVMHPQGRFNNVEGPLTVQYDQSKGSLSGRGGPVEGFTETFTPTDLEPKPNPHVAENIEVSAEANVDFIKVTYKQRYADEQITVNATVTVDFIYVGIINP